MFADWISLTVERDIHQIKRFKLDPQQALDILRAVSDLEEPTAANISKNTKINPKKVNSYLLTLKTLFVLFELKPFKGSTGKTQYFLTDVGLLDYFKASFHKKLRTWFYLEMYSQLSCKGIALETLSYYRSSKGSIVDLIYLQDKKLEIVKLIPFERYDERDFLIFNSLRTKYSKEYELSFTVLSGASQKTKGNGFTIYPWESIA